MNWTDEEDAVIAVVQHLYRDPYGLVTLKVHTLYPTLHRTAVWHLTSPYLASI